MLGSHVLAAVNMRPPIYATEGSTGAGRAGKLLGITSWRLVGHQGTHIWPLCMQGCCDPEVASIGILDDPKSMSHLLHSVASLWLGTSCHLVPPSTCNGIGQLCSVVRCWLL